MTLAGTSIGLTVSGSLTFQATNFSATYTGVTTFNATTTGKIITTNGVAFVGAVTLNGVGGGWTLGSALTCSGTFTLTNGTFDTSSSGNYALTCNLFSSSNNNVRTINLNASTITLQGTGSPFNTLSSGNLTFNAGTSQFNFNGSSLNFIAVSKTFYNVSFLNTAIATVNIAGGNTFNNLLFTGRTTIGIGSLNISGDLTINGTLTIGAGTSAAYRLFFKSNNAGVTRTITTTAIASLSDVDFKDIIAAGASGTWSGTRLGDAKGNSNITFSAAKTVYFGAASGDWGAVAPGTWSLTSGGALADAAFPLVQDTVVFNSTAPSASSTVTINANYNIGTVDMSVRTANAMTLSCPNSPLIFGNWINGTATTISGGGSFAFNNNTANQTITSAGRSFGVSCSNVKGTFTLQLLDAFTSTSAYTLGDGTFDLNGKTCTVFTFSVGGTTKTLALNGGNLVCTNSGTCFSVNSPTGFTCTGGGASTITLSSTNPKTFDGGSSTYPCTLLLQNSAAGGTHTIVGSNTFNTITSGVQGLTISFTAGTTTTFINDFICGIGSTIQSTTAATHTLSKASGIIYIVGTAGIYNSNATGGASWYAGSGSADAGGNSGWIFTNPPSTATSNFLVFF